MHLTFSEEVIDWAVQKLLPLFRLKGAPKTTGDRERYAGAVLRIAHPQLVFLRCLHWDASFDTIEAALRLTEDEKKILKDTDEDLAELLEAKTRMPWVGNPLVHLPPALICAALRLPPAELDKIRIDRPGLGKVNPLDWLVDAAVDECRWFMEAIELRLIFIERFPCADGKKHVQERGAKGEKQ